MRLLILACIVACVRASSWGEAPAPLVAKAAVLSTGHSTSSRTQDSAGNYAFSYNEQHSTGGSSRAESGNGWGAQGSYTLNTADSRQRTVKYIADGAGFRAAIATNEPGTAALSPASTALSFPHLPPQPVQPLPAPVLAAPVAEHAPLALAAPAPEPILAAPAPIAIAHPVVKAIPAVSSYSTSINHVAPAPIAVAAPALPALPAAPVLTSGWSIPAPAPVALPAPAPIQLRGWN